MQASILCNKKRGENKNLNPFLKQEYEERGKHTNFKLNNTNFYYILYESKNQKRRQAKKLQPN